MGNAFIQNKQWQRNDRDQRGMINELISEKSNSSSAMGNNPLDRHFNIIDVFEKGHNLYAEQADDEDTQNF
jgi:hypothetical protein